jgi:hypothetical protein
VQRIAYFSVNHDCKVFLVQMCITNAKLHLFDFMKNNLDFWQACCHFRYAAAAERRRVAHFPENCSENAPCPSVKRIFAQKKIAQRNTEVSQRGAEASFSR